MPFEPSTPQPSRPALRPDPRALRALVIAVGTAVLLALALSVNLLPRAYEVREGDVAPYSVRAPRKASYVSQLRTRAAREQVAAQVAPVVELDYPVIAQQRRALADLIQAVGTVRAAPYQGVEDRRDGIRQLLSPPLSDATIQRLAEADETRWNAVVSESQRLLADVLKDRIGDDAVEDARRTLPLRVSPSFGDVDRGAIVELAGRFVRSNLVVNEEATARARRDAQEAVAPVVQVYERGQTVVRDGQLIGPLDVEALEALGLRNPELDWQSLGGALLFAATLVGILGAYVWHFDPELLRRHRRLALLAAALVVTTVAAKMVIPGRPLWVYVFPLPAVAMLVSTLLDARLAIVIGVLLSLATAWIAGNSMEAAAVGIVGTAVGALAVWRKERLFAYFVAGAFIALAQFGTYLAFFLTSRSDDWPSLTVIGFEMGVNGMLSSLLAVGSFAIVGRVFGILTTMQLLELATPTQPLLRRLLMEAPGTYHHSIMVGNLAERAAEVIGADPLVVRVAAYYHDIGKLERPWAFIENQADIRENIHESLDPVTSAQVIAAHVMDGVALAEKYGLPARIREMIPQHHGTRTISFFYQQAAEQSESEVDPLLFTYPGPRPQSREAALLMLADSTEAAARASRDHSPEALELLVERIVRQRLEDGQFDECDLTLRDLTRIKQSFVALLNGIYHPRIPYPPTTSASESASALPLPTDAPA